MSEVKDGTEGAPVVADDETTDDEIAQDWCAGAAADAGAVSRADEPVSITAYPNGPLLVRGTFEILTPTGEVIPPRRKTVALCRCGVSTIKPFCDGSHKAIGFTTEPEAPDGQRRVDG